MKGIKEDFNKNLQQIKNKKDNNNFKEILNIYRNLNWLILLMKFYIF